MNPKYKSCLWSILDVDEIERAFDALHLQKSRNPPASDSTSDENWRCRIDFFLE